MSQLSRLFARRFLFSPKSHSVINVISAVSIAAVGVPVAAMVILLSVFNGFDDLIRRMYNDFDPDLLVVPASGKVFDPSDLDAEAVLSLEGVAATSFILEESALLEYGTRQHTATVRGVDSAFTKVVPIGGMLYAGTAEGRGAVTGMGIAYELGMRLGDEEPLKFYAPRRGSFSALLPVSAFSAAAAPVEGIFQLDAETDSEYVIVPIALAEELFDYSGRVSGLMVRFGEGASAKGLKSRVRELAGPDFEVLTRYEQKASMYRIMTYEKWGIFFIGLMVLVIASFSIVGSLIMLVIDKRDNIRTLGALGSTPRFVRSVFIRLGMTIGVIGAAGGLVLGAAVCAVQQIFGVIPMPAETFLVDSYPVLMRPADIAAVFLSFLAVCYLITKFTVLKTITKSDLGL